MTSIGILLILFLLLIRVGIIERNLVKLEESINAIQQRVVEPIEVPFYATPS